MTADQLFPIVWDGVCQVEGIGLKVIFITADGASLNRKFLKMHHMPSDYLPIYKTCNPYSQEESFFSSQVHLT